MNKALTLIAGFVLASSVTINASAAKTLVYCSEGSPEGFNPAFYTAGTTFDATSKNIFNKLVEFERGSTKIIPGLAESWTISDDGTNYTFKLRKGVKFHSNKKFKPHRDFNADDVLFSLNRQRLKDHPYHTVSGGNYEYWNGMSMTETIKDIKKIDDYTVSISLNQPNAPFLANLAMDFASIMSAEYADKMMKAGTPEVVDNQPIGTGPFEFVDYRKDSQIRYKAFSKYWGGKTPIDRLVFSITPDASVRYAKMQANECQVMPYPNPADLEKMRADKNINLLSQEGLNVGFLAFNVEKKPFDDRKVRQALNYAINKQAILDAIFQGAGTVAKNPIPPTIWSYNNDTVDYDYNPEKAKQLLAEAGYSDGFSTNIWAMPVQRPYNPNARRMAELIQADWAAVGVKAEIVSYEWGEYLARTKEGEHDTALLGWTGDNGDPDNFLYVLLSCDAVGASNRARFCNADFDKLLKAAQTTSDIAERTKLYKQAQLLFKKEAPWVTIAHSVVYKPVRPEVVDFKIDPLGGHIFYGVDLK
ncbi:ABC transporter substrate-binding protein [Gynuella sp.]|uniref:ABC transporter substrate-binding protein n=1 Tax=Gynuella sp. TaxID=2969146 RepID=UPI003D0A2611